MKRPQYDTKVPPTVSVEHYASLVGTEIGRSEWTRVDQCMIDGFAHLTGDHQFIHVDPLRAKSSAFGTTIAHGLLTLSLVGALGPRSIPAIKGAKEGINLGFDRIRFTAPVPSGSNIRAIFQFKDMREKGPGQIWQLLGVAVEIEGREKPALVADWLILTRL